MSQPIENSLVRVAHLEKSFDSVQAVRSVSFELFHNSITGFIGPNGAGKTTTFRMLAGLIEPTSGQITICGQRFTPESFELKRQIGYLPESIPLYPNLRVLETLTLFGKLRNLNLSLRQNRIQQVVEMCRLETVLEKKCSALSKGFRQRVGLALALIHDPKILILDEPTEGLDPVQIFEIRKLIQTLSQNKTIILSSHILSEITELSQHLILMKDGVILAQGQLADFGGSTQSLEKKFVELYT